MVSITKDGQVIQVPYNVVSFYLAAGWQVTGGLVPGGNIQMTGGGWMLLLLVGGIFFLSSKGAK